MNNVKGASGARLGGAVREFDPSCLGFYNPGRDQRGGGGSRVKEVGAVCRVLDFLEVDGAQRCRAADGLVDGNVSHNGLDAFNYRCVCVAPR